MSNTTTARKGTGETMATSDEMKNAREDSMRDLREALRLITRSQRRLRAVGAMHNDLEYARRAVSESIDARGKAPEGARRW